MRNHEKGGDDTSGVNARAEELIHIELQFDTAQTAGAPLGDIASSLVSLHDLLRDLGAIAADPASAEYRDIQVVGIEMRRPLTITLSLRAIPAEAVRAFQEICRTIVLGRDRRAPAIGIETAIDIVANAGGRHAVIEDREIQRLQDHIVILQRAEVPLKRVVVKD